MKKIILCLSLLLLLGAGMGVSPAPAATFDLFDWAYNVDGTTTSQPAISPGPNNLGTFTYSLSGVGSHTFIAFFDYEIDELINTYFNEYGTAVGAPAAGQSWEIDEPGYAFGDIYDNFLAATLDNSNGVPSPAADDVSMALGWTFDLGNPLDLAVITMVLSDTAPASGFYLRQTDPESGADIYFSSRLEVSAVPVPGAVYLLGSGLVLLLGFGRKKLLKGPNPR